MSTVIFNFYLYCHQNNRILIYFIHIFTIRTVYIHTMYIVQKNLMILYYGIESAEYDLSFYITIV